MAKKPLLFVDTNIFLDFYRAGGEAGLTLLKHLESLSDLLIMTDQIEMEFLNNRQTVISSALGTLKAPPVSAFAPAYLADTKTAAGIEKNFKQIRKRVEVMKERFARILKDPGSADPVFKSFQKVVSSSLRNLKLAGPEKQKQVHDLALQRYQRGCPPRKKQDHSIGDAINWEWILDCCKLLSADVIIVSRDGDFGLSMDRGYYLNDFLAQEFKEKVSTKRRAELSPSLTQALKRVAVKVTAAEEREEQSMIKSIVVHPAIGRVQPGELVTARSAFPSFWPDMLKRVKMSSPFAHAYLVEANGVTCVDKTLTIHFPSECCEHVALVDVQRNHDLLKAILKDIGAGEGHKVVFSRPTAPDVVTSAAPEEAPPSDEDDVPF